MGRTLRFEALISILFLISSCANICKIQESKIEISERQIKFGPSSFPCKKQNEYEDAVKKAITAIYSDEFENKLTEYIKDSIGIGEHKKTWEGLIAKDIVTKMRSQIDGESIETYGGLNGWILNKFSGNLAFDGTTSGPIRINRIPLKYEWRDPSSIANTIAHETAHRIGLVHPHSDTNLEIAYKEPPYVIGKIIENISRRQIIN